MTRPPFREAIESRVLVCDGAMGTMLYARGIFLNRSFDDLNLTQPDLVAEVHQAYVRAGADVIELGMPFTDPMADGPAIQLSSQRALRAGQTLKQTFALVKAFRADDPTTPIVLMGYYNPIYVYPAEAFLDDAAAAGVDGLIVVDVPPEADDELCLPAVSRGLNFIRLATPTTDDKRLKTVLKNTSGFLYYVSITGITGAASANPDDVQLQVARLKRATTLPVAVGFGISSAADAEKLRGVPDAVVVGAAFMRAVTQDREQGAVERVLALARELTNALEGATRP